MVVDSIFVDSPAPLDIRIDAIESNLCNSENEGIILTTSIGGTPPYTFFWSNGENTDDLKSLENGNYNLTVNDSNGCIASFDNITIQSPPNIDINITQLQHETCRSGGDGYISVQSNGGSGNYNYNWSNGETNVDFISNLESGIYAVTVIDEFGCKQSLNNIEILEENVDLPVNVHAVAMIDCFGDDDASITANTSQGTLPYDFNWSNGTQNIGNFSNDTIIGLAAGNYNLTVTDGLGCTGISDIIEITEPPVLVYTVATINKICELGGSISLDVQGGVEPYQINWSHGATGPNLMDLDAGNYQVTVIDAQNCSFSLTELNIIDLEIVTFDLEITHATGSSLGSIDVTVLTGTAPYVFTIDGVEQGLGEGFLLDGIEPGEYELEVTDAEGCSTIELFTIDLIDATSETLFDLSYTVYPNPTTGRIFIEGRHLPASDIKIMNLQGQNIPYNLTYQMEKAEINIPNAQDGIYLLLINDGESVFTKKMVLHQD